MYIEKGTTNSNSTSFRKSELRKTTESISFNKSNKEETFQNFTSKANCSKTILPVVNAIPRNPNYSTGTLLLLIGTIYFILFAIFFLILYFKKIYLKSRICKALGRGKLKHNEIYKLTTKEKKNYSIDMKNISKPNSKQNAQINSSNINYKDFDNEFSITTVENPNPITREGRTVKNLNRSI